MPNRHDNFNPFDVLEELKDKGFEQDQAESLAKFFSNVELRNMATKQDLEASTLALKQDIKELDYKIELVKKDIKELEVKIGSIGKDLKASQGTQTIQIIGAIAAIIAIFRFLPEILN